MRVLLIYTLLLLLPLAAAAQKPDSLLIRGARPGEEPARIADSVAIQMSDTITDNMPEAGAMIKEALKGRDTVPGITPAVSTRQPGEAQVAAFMQDSLFLQGTTQWTLSADYTTEEIVPLDTAFSLFHRYRITDKYSDFSAYTGNYGLPLYEINFFDREWKPDRFLYAYYEPFMFTPYNTLFINTHVPFTELKWSNGGARSKAEQTFRVRHSQNVNRFMNFGLIYDIVFNLGQYDLQRAIDKNFLLHGSYNRNNYSAYASAGINNHDSEENGGILDKEDLSRYSPEDVPVLLNEYNGATSTLKNRYLMLVQRFTPGGKRDTANLGTSAVTGPVTFSYIGIYEWNRRRYFDKYPLSSLYDTVMISRTETQDSLSQSLLTNTLRVDFAAGSRERFRIGAGAGIRSELRSYGQIMPGDSLTRPDTVKTSMNSLVLTGKVFNNIGSKFGWSATGDLWFQGYRAGDFIVEGRIYKDFATSRKGMITWDATGTLASYTPSYWYFTWGSNNFSWQSDNKREFRLMAGSSIIWPERGMSLKFNYAIVDNFIQMGTGALPVQNDGGLSVAALTVKKDFVFWKLHLDNTVLLQQSTNSEVLSLPLVTARSAFFFDHIFRFRATNGELSFQLGADAMIHTPYYPMNYMPATGRYFSQTESKTGNYPFVNVFMNFKVKRTRIFIMADHVNSGLMGNEYFLIPGYPLNIRMIRYGFAWTFYD